MHRPLVVIAMALALAGCAGSARQDRVLGGALIGGGSGALIGGLAGRTGWRRSCRRADRRCSGCDYCRRYATRLVLLLAETSTLLCALLIRQNFAALIDVGLPTRRYVIATAVLR